MTEYDPPVKVKINVGGIDFRELRKLVEQKTRTAALSYFNGVPVAWA